MLQGAGGSEGGLRPTKTPPSARENVPACFELLISVLLMGFALGFWICLNCVDGVCFLGCRSCLNCCFLFC